MNDKVYKYECDPPPMSRTLPGDRCSILGSKVPAVVVLVKKIAVFINSLSLCIWDMGGLDFPIRNWGAHRTRASHLSSN